MAALCQSPLALKNSSRLVPPQRSSFAARRQGPAAAVVECAEKRGPHAGATRRTAPRRPSYPGEPNAAPSDRAPAGRPTEDAGRPARTKAPGDDRRHATRRPRTRGTNDTARDGRHHDERTRREQRTRHTSERKEHPPRRNRRRTPVSATPVSRCPSIQSKSSPRLPWSWFVRRGQLSRAERHVEVVRRGSTLNTNPAAVSSGAGGPGQAGAG